MSNSRKKLLIYAVFPAVMILLVVGVHGLVALKPLWEYGDGLIIAAPYILLTLYGVLVYRMGEKHIWPLPVIVFGISLCYAVFTARRHTIKPFLITHTVSWQTDFEWRMMAGLMLYVLPAVAAALVYRLVTRLAEGRRKKALGQPEADAPMPEHDG